MHELIEQSQEFRVLCHRAAVEAGWWTDIETGERIIRNVGEVLMLGVSEIAEAVEAWERRAMDDKLPHRRGVEVELADYLIRTFDITSGLGFGEAFDDAIIRLSHDMVPYHGSDGGPVSEKRFLGIIRHVADAMEADRKGSTLKRYPDLPGVAVHLAQSVRATVQLGILLGADLVGAVREKVEFNRNRADHKIENRRLEGGKRY